ncbi:DNA-binding transcriptional ArsR family regulator [Caldalkalibacillus uzonensis]|uniref:DNA-binding transcriptional ArsR family regulator n=1 Tax=Caldalkalibacillus uzonensis TaxID=353224 RepID=A0ABU0CVY5_9BACI|nr:metalloregulator ArsR/SmtB family transcription factor [Caldalkalibacillus uzonensis]MDQ0339690.1 DNA-binding transcriptional ArsR family regulator [Caldalkalibacillus uzonensis]
MGTPKHDVFQAIADPTRRRLIRLLAEQELPVTEISKHFPMSRTAVSKHLRILNEAGLVQKKKAGREIRYKTQPDPLLEVKRWLAYYDRFWDNKLASLKYHLEQEQKED